MRVVDGELISLTDLWRGEGMVDWKKPLFWLRTLETAEFLMTCLKVAPGQLLANKPDPHHSGSTVARRWAETIIKECESQGLIVRTPGRNGGTFAHRQIALAYAGYLSPKLRLLVQQIFIERLEETVDPDGSVERRGDDPVKSPCVVVTFLGIG